jgi:hypothetical protein
MVSPDPEVVLGKGRALFRVADLLGLDSLVGCLVAEKRGKRSRKA